MMHKFFLLGAVLAAGLMVGCSEMKHGHKHGGAAHTAPTAAEIAAAKDVGNTHCPVTGEAVTAGSPVAIHDGKLYHFCCAGCAGKFHEDPQKYIKQMNADPAKYGLKG